MPEHILAIDQGTTSTRAIVVDRSGAMIAVSQREHTQILPRPGWVEHDPIEILHNVHTVIDSVLAKAGLTRHDLAAIGIANQRETTVMWDRKTGQPVGNAIVWQDTRTQSIVDSLAADGGTRRLIEKTGLPLATYFSATKLAWMFANITGLRARAERGDLLCGTMDTWLLWNLTGGARGGTHATDVTNASRTLLMDLGTLAWAPELVAAFDIPPGVLPEIRSSSEVYGWAAASGALQGIPIAGMLGDQQAATFGQTAFAPGESKGTYGTGNFLMVNTGGEIVRSEHGLLTTVAYQLGDEAPRYALEGSIAVTGSLVQWLRDGLGIINDASEIEAVAASDNGGVYIVPAFSGLFAPHWRPDARGVIVGLTRFSNRGHLARAALEATAFQTREVLDAIEADTGIELTELRVDGGMVVNDTLMQFQADLLGMPVIRPVATETTALGAAYAAGLAVGLWRSTEEIRGFWGEGKRWSPTTTEASREAHMRFWRKAVNRSLNWVDD